MMKLLLIGWISIVSSVGGADVMVDEQDGIRMHGQQINLEVPAGRHLIMVDKEGYYPYIDTISVQNGQHRTLTVWMKPKSPKAIKQTSNFTQIAWDYQLMNGKNAIRWCSLGAGLGTGLDLHLSFFSMRWGLLAIDPCLVGMNIPFCNNVSHTKIPWHVYSTDRRDDNTLYHVAIPNQEHQFYYTPMVGIHLPIFDYIALVLSAGPQISWTKVTWQEAWRENPFTNYYTYTSNSIPENKYNFDSIWFSLQAGILYTGRQSDILIYTKYQDGFFIGLEFRF